MNEELREELYNYMIQNYNELSHDEIIDTLDTLEKLEFEDYLYEDKDYLYDQIDNIIEEKLKDLHTQAIELMEKLIKKYKLKDEMSSLDEFLYENVYKFSNKDKDEIVDLIDKFNE